MGMGYRQRVKSAIFGLLILFTFSACEQSRSVPHNQAATPVATATLPATIAGGDDFLLYGQPTLVQIINGSRVPGVNVPLDWHITNHQLAPSPEKFPPHADAQGTMKEVWCVIIAPPIVVNAVDNQPQTIISHYIVIETSRNWYAYAVDAAQSGQGVAVFISVGCTIS